MARVTAIRKTAGQCEKRAASAVFMLPRSLVLAVLVAFASVSVLLMALLSIWNATRGLSPFAPGAGELFSLQLFFGAISVPLLCLVAAIAGRRKIQAQHEQAPAESEPRFRHPSDPSPPLSGRVIKAQDEERQRIARELHDDIGQRLTLLMIELDRLQRVADSSLQPSMLQLLNEAQAISDCVRSMSHDLHPARVDLLPLGTALSGLCREFAQRTAIEVHFEEHNVPAQLPLEIKLCLYRVAQEALQNIAKHSRATQAEVELTGDSNSLNLRVDDDGVGFAVQQPPVVDGLGLASMRERLASVDGSIKVTAAPGQGTRIEAYAPLRQTAAGGLAETA